MQTIILNNSVAMPALGYGTYQITDPDTCTTCVSEALERGYRLIDTAQAYGNEGAVGKGIAQAPVAREDVFLTTKLWFRSYEPEEARDALARSLELLRTDYLDLVLLHWPFGNTYGAYRVLEHVLRQGNVRAIGVSNFEESQLIDLVEFNEVVPQVNQVETNLLCQQASLHDLMTEMGIAHQAYAPFGQGSREEMFDPPAVTETAAAHGATSHQVALRFLTQQGISAIPKTTDPKRMEENLASCHLTLTDYEMTALKALDRKEPLIGRSQDEQLARFAMTW